MSSTTLPLPWGSHAAPAPGWQVPGWDLGPPRTDAIGDHAVDRRGQSLAGRTVALIVTGGIAALRAPALARALRREGARVVPMVSAEGARFVSLDALAWASDAPVVTALSSRAEHLAEDAPVDAYLVAPATYDAINKLAQGIADGPVLATLASALGRMERGRCAVLVAPTMHGTMHNSLLVRSLQSLSAMGVVVVPPRDALGKDNLPDDPQLVAAVARSLRPRATAPRAVLIAGRWAWNGRIPAEHPLDWRAHAWELHLRGVALGLILPHGVRAIPEGIAFLSCPNLGEAVHHAQALRHGLDAVWADAAALREDPGATALSGWLGPATSESEAGLAWLHLGYNTI